MYYEEKIEELKVELRKLKIFNESEKRGFKKGIKIDQKPGYGGCGGTHLIKDDNLYYNSFSDNLSIGGIGIYNNGNWAKIIEETPEYTMEELTKKLGHSFKIKK